MLAELDPVEQQDDINPRRQLARVLLADRRSCLASAIKSLLTAVGYEVQGAASAAEAASRLDETDYQLVLADLRTESDEAGPRLLAYARQKEYHPATALICSDMSETTTSSTEDGSDERVVRISNENVSYLLASVAELISQRADRRIRQALRKAS